MHNFSKLVSYTFGFASALFITGCPNPNNYGTPRTTPAGRISHSIAAEAIGVAGGGNSVTLPTAPTYTLRIGAADNVDIGIRVANMSNLGADAKVNFLKGGFDMAVNPGLQFFYFGLSGTDSSGTRASSSITGTYIHLPLIFGANLSEGVTLVPTVGVMYGLVAGASSVASTDSNDSVRASRNTGIIGRLGFGANLRLGNAFALHPELTVMKGFGEGATGVLYLFGLGFNFGALPEFGDIK